MEPDQLLTVSLKVFTGEEGLMVTVEDQNEEPIDVFAANILNQQSGNWLKMDGSAYWTVASEPQKRELSKCTAQKMNNKFKQLNRRRAYLIGFYLCVNTSGFI